MSRARDTRPDGLLGHRRSLENERTDPGWPPDMTDPGGTSVVVTPITEHLTPSGGGDDLIEETVKALEQAAERGVVFSPKAGASVADTTSVGIEKRNALAYWSKDQHSPVPGHPTPLPEETMIVRRTPADAPRSEHSSQTGTAPEPVQPAWENRLEASPAGSSVGASLGELLDSVENEPPVSRRDVPTHVPPMRSLKRLLRPQTVIPVAVFAAIIAAGTFFIGLATRRAAGEHLAGEGSEAPAMSASAVGSAALNVPPRAALPLPSGNLSEPVAATPPATVRAVTSAPAASPATPKQPSPKAARPSVSTVPAPLPPELEILH